MKRNFLLLIAAALLLTVTTIVISDGWVYTIAALMATTVVVAIRSFSAGVLKITRWAKANPRKTQVVIGLLQILVICTALLVGYDLKELGYQLNESVSIVFGIILVSAFFSIRFLPKENTIAIPASVNKDRMAYMAIVLSAFAVLVVTGNRIEDKFPNSPISIALKSVDGRIFGTGQEDNLSFESNGTILTNENTSLLAFASVAGDEKTISPDIQPDKELKEKIKPSKKGEKLEKKKKKMMKRMERLRKMFGAGATVGTVLLIILLVIFSCAGICLIAIGGSAGAVILGVVVLGLSIFGWVKVFQKKNRTKEA